MTRQLLLATAAYWYSADLNNLMDNSSRFSGPAIWAVLELFPSEVRMKFGAGRPARPHISRRGAAATKRSRRAKCVRSRLGTASRRAEWGDSVAHGGHEVEISG